MPNLIFYTPLLNVGQINMNYTVIASLQGNSTLVLRNAEILMLFHKSPVRLPRSPRLRSLEEGEGRD